ncbi:MAG: hypothetical protein MJZ86_06260 [Bacteroidales bacterium]|nr:hypothetical protein [Bacteroidales bacterium]
MQNNDHKIFWNWFQSNCEQLTMLNDLTEAESQRLLDEMQHQLDQYCEGLTFEIGDQTNNGRTLTISAEGDFDLFRYVVDLCDNAPDIDWWEFVPFKQPKGKALKVTFDKYRFDTAQMAFMQLECEEEPDIIGLRVALPGLPANYKPQPDDPNDDDRLVGVYVTLEALIGEFDCTTLIGYLELAPMPEEPFKAGYRPLDDLPEFVEWFKRSRNRE